MRYRSGWYVIDDEPQILFAMGIHGQNVFVDRANRIVIAKVSSQNSPIDNQALWLTHKAVPDSVACSPTPLSVPPSKSFFIRSQMPFHALASFSGRS
jgi:hypothetical protein